MARIYVASSWRNALQPDVVAKLRRMLLQPSSTLSEKPHDDDEHHTARTT